MEVLKTLFKSEHFFEEENMGVVIKSNIDNIVHFYRSLDLRIDEDYFYTIGRERQIPKILQTEMPWELFTIKQLT